ncbi:hypothetical protein ABZ990_25575 [Streptomyces sp. NPDC046203]|uniref:hypothetical protein n=1 Tax=Streptomyces sp. NPDC046203 TaxID=3154602 RepID=UPI0033EE5FB3
MRVRIPAALAFAALAILGTATTAAADGDVNLAMFNGNSMMAIGVCGNDINVLAIPVDMLPAGQNVGACASTPVSED